MNRLDVLDDEALVGLAVVGNLEAYDALVRRFRPAVTAVAEMELGCSAKAHDAAQDAFLAAYRALPHLRDPARFGGWLCAIVRNCARRAARRDGHDEPTEPSQLDAVLLSHSEALGADPAEGLVRGEALRLAREALADLPPDHQVALRLYYLDEWPVARIAEFLSLPVTTVKWRLHRGRELLRRRLAQDEETTDGRQ